MKLRRVGLGDEKQTQVVPMHAEMDRGTLKATFRQASGYIPAEPLEPFFYGE